MDINFETFSEYYSQRLINVESCIFNIPHSSVVIPFDTTHNLTSEILERTDWEVEKIFDIPKSTRIVANFSRVFCDVDVDFPMHWEISAVDPTSYVKKGIEYTRNVDGKQMKVDDHIQYIHENYYKPYYKEFTEMVDEKLMKISGDVHIINCHTFPDEGWEKRRDENSPDICLSTDKFHTPEYLLRKIKNFFESEGLEVLVNSPFSGTKVPDKFFERNLKVKSIRIEINRKLYMDEKTKQVNLEKVVWLNQMINKLF